MAMNTNNSGLISRLSEIITDEIYIGYSKSDLSQEIHTNMWCISATQKECDETSREDIIGFINELINNRRTQVRNSPTKHGMIFYLWFDAQATQLGFNLISDFHEHLPFGCSIRLVDQPDSIVDAFLQSPYHDGISMDEVLEVDKEISENILESVFGGIVNDNYVLDVYKVDL
jgi:hypothetical protein